MNPSNFSNRLFHPAFILIFFILIGGCMNLDNLSDDNSIANFTIISHEPRSIELAATEIISDTIYIPISFGKYKFPLKFYAGIDITDDVDGIIGIDLKEEQTFESMDDELTFYVMAKSGMTRTYVIRPKEIPLDENNSISKYVQINSITPELYYSNYAIASQKDDTLTLFTVGGDYPITIVPEFTIADESNFIDFDNGNQEVTFEGSSNVHTVQVISKSGASREWKIKLRTTEILSGDMSLYPKYLISTTNIEPRTIGFESTIRNAEIFVNNTINTISILIPKPLTGDQTLPLDFDLSFELEEGVESFAIEKESVISFNELSEVKTLYLMDPLNSISREWNILLKQSSLDDADVVSVRFDYVADDVVTEAECIKSGRYSWSTKIKKEEPCIALDNKNIEIYPGSNEIIIPTSNFKMEPAWGHWHGLKYILHNYKDQKRWNIQITNIEFTLSNGATATATLPTKWDMLSNYKADLLGGDNENLILDPAIPNSCYKEELKFEIKSQSGTNTKEWTMKLRDPLQAYIPSTECSISSFSVGRILPNYAEYEQDVVLDNASKTIIIKLIEDTDCYPIKIYPTYNISAYSKITSQNHGKDPLIFETPTSFQTVSILAQDLTTSSNWSIKLLPPVKAVGADIETFQILGQTPGYDIGSTEVDAGRGVVKINIKHAPTSTPLSLDINMLISDKASASIPLRGTVNFSKITEKVVLNVTAEDGNNKLWTIALDYRPQIPESNFDSWTKDSKGLPQPASPWCTANNTNVTGSTSEEYNGGRVPIMRAKSTLGIFASGSVFLGRFEFEMAIGMSDPISLTYFGYPMQATAKIKGIEVDINYLAGEGSGNNNGMSLPFDYGSCVAELIDYNNKGTDPSYSNFQYHGLYSDGGPPRTSGRENNARSVANAKVYFSNFDGNDHNGNPLTKVKKGEWEKIFIPIRYSGSGIPEYTHIHIIFGCSGLGDLFKGYTTSVLKVDNVKLIYE